MAIITLTSDIGLQDYLVGAIKGQLHQICPQYKIVDISHDILPFNFPQAAYLCKSAVNWFPEKTCHFILVNLFDHKKTPYLLCSHQGQYFFCADNGLIPMILGENPETSYHITHSDTRLNTLEVVQRFAETASALYEGVNPDELAPAAATIMETNPLNPFMREDYIEGQIIYIDRFENVIVNITREQFEKCRKGRGFKIYVMRDDYIDRISENYADVSEGGKVALFNTAGYLEIAINKGNAAGLFGLQSYSRELQPAGKHFQQHLFYQTIRIHFE